MLAIWVTNSITPPSLIVLACSDTVSILFAFWFAIKLIPKLYKKNVNISTVHHALCCLVTINKMSHGLQMLCMYQVTAESKVISEAVPSRGASA